MHIRSEGLLAATGLYIIAFAVHLASLCLPAIPANQKGLNAEQAWLDLHRITRKPHPYNSHENDAVRRYILRRLTPLALAYDHVHLDDDTRTNITYFDLSKAVYFEGKNILVKIDGTDPTLRDQGGVLFSAHLDSVSSGVGATDDGMGVITCMQMAEYFAVNRPRRTVIININDGEEDGLNGAHAFLGHHWSRIPKTFVNLEGSGAGGPPILFRTTSTLPIRAAAKSIQHPRANVLTSDAFAYRLIRSRTDFSVYELGGGYEGIDLAFYQRRVRYHTKFDSIPFLNGGIRSLWSMMEATRDVGAALANEPSEESTDAYPVVYFDGKSFLLFNHSPSLTCRGVSVLGRVLVVLSQHTLLIGHCIALVALPLIRLVIRIFQQQPSDGRRTTGQLVIRQRLRKALGVVLLLQGCVAWLFSKVNPFVVYACPYLVLAVHSLLALCVFSFAIPENRSEFDFDTVQALLQQLYVFSWILTLGATALQIKVGLSGVYFILGWNVSLWIVVVVGASLPPVKPQAVVNAKGKQGKQVNPRDHLKARVPKRYRLTSLLQVALSVVPVLLLFLPIVEIVLGGMTQSMADGSNPVLIHMALALCAFLVTVPIIPWVPTPSRSRLFMLVTFILALFAYGCFVFPFSVETPFKVFFEQSVDITTSLNLVPSSNNTGAEIVSFTELTGVQPFLLRDVVPSIPNTFALTRRSLQPRGLDGLEDKDKDEVECINTPDRPGTETCIWNDNLLPRFGPVLPGWNVDQGRLSVDRWIRAQIERTGPQSARFKIRGLHSRNCRIYLDSAKISAFRVVDGDGQSANNGNVDGIKASMKPTRGFENPPEGAEVVVLFSRGFGKEWVVDVDWMLEEEPEFSGGSGSGEGAGVTPAKEAGGGESGSSASSAASSQRTEGTAGPSVWSPAVQGRVACEWSEYASGRRFGDDSVTRAPGTSAYGDGDGEGDGEGVDLVGSEIPAFEETIEFVPRWVAVSKAHHGLLEVWARFEI